MNIKDEITQQIDQTLKDLNLPQFKYTLDHPGNEAHGDYATNVAMALFPILKKEGGGVDYPNPLALAETISKNLESKILNPKSAISNIEIAGPGFINFSLSKRLLLEKTQDILNNHFEKPLKNQKIAVEYTDPNPFKEFHIGHLYSNIIGESISRIYEANGAVVWRGNFYGDCGLHISKSVWGVAQKMNQEILNLSDIENLPLKERQNLLGQGYAQGVIKYDSDSQAKSEILEINSLIYHASENKNHPLIKIYLAGLKWSLEYFETYYKRLGTKFDGYYPESEVGEIGLQLVEQGIKQGILEEGEGGAIVFKGEKHGLHTRVFINKLGLPTYEAKDLGLVQAKYNDFKFDRSINVFGKEIDEYYKVVKKVMEKVLPELGKKQIHLAHGMVNFPSGKMSSRSGNVITVEWLLNHSRDLALDLINNDQLTTNEKDEIAEMVGQAAIKYDFLKSHIGDNVTFDFDQSVTFTGNSGPYLQYTHARCCSVIVKSEINPKEIDISHLSSVISNPEESQLLRFLYRYPEVVSQSATNLAPHLICTYLYELAQRFNAFYNQHSILGTADNKVDPLTINFRLLLTASTAQILKNGLHLLGISAPSKM